MESDQYNFFFFYDSIPVKYRVSSISFYEAFKYRNLLIMFTLFEVTSSLFGFSYYFIPIKSSSILINIISLTLSLLGFFSIIYIKEYGIVAYCFLTILISSAYFIFLFFDLFISNLTFFGNFPLQSIYDMICGIMTTYFLSLIYYSGSQYRETTESNGTEETKILIEKNISKSLEK